MNTGWRKGISWAISLSLHVILLLVVSLSGGGLSAGNGMEVLEVGFVELGPTISASRAEQAGAQINADNAISEPQKLPQKELPQKESPPVKSVEQPKTNEPVTSNQKQMPTDSNQEPAQSGNSGTNGNNAGNMGSVSDPGPGNNGTSQGGNKGQGLGSGEGFVLSRPVTYPKNAQNEGSEGEVLAEVRLTPDGEIQVALISSSGDQRLDSYSLRALKEAWQYARPAFPVKIRIALIFRSGEVKVVFQGSEQWERSELQP